MYYKKWNKAILNEQLKKLNKLFAENPSYEIGQSIGIIEDLLNNSPRIFIGENSFNQQLSTDKSIIEENASFMAAINRFANHSELLNTKVPNLQEYDIPNNVLLAFLHDFYNSIDREFAKYFNRIYQERKNNLRITNNKGNGYTRNYMYYIPTLNYAYVNIYKSDTIDDFLNLIHEYAHVVADQMLYRNQYDSYPFIELLPLLMQQIASDKILNYFDIDDEVHKSDAKTAKLFMNYASQIRLQQDFFTTRNVFTERKQYITEFAQFANNTKTKTERMLNVSLKEKISYVIPYITMIELYNLYYEDPEKALYIMKAIIRMKHRDNYYNMLEDYGIHLNEHSKEFIQTRKKNITDIM